MLDNSLYKVQRVIDSDMDIDFNLQSIQIGHTVVNNWNDAVEILLSPEEQTRHLK
mgnify:CR=1 FL=1